MSPIDLSLLPAPNVVEPLDYEQVFADRKAALLALYNAEDQAAIEATLALESEPLTKLLQESAYRELLLRNRINDAARAVMLAYARDKDLDNLAAFFGIQRLVITPADPDNYVEAVMERDEDLRARVQLAPQGYSVAGPAGAYRSHAMNTDGRVLDASATSPSPCEVVVTILSREGNGTASSDLLAAVSTALSDDNVRPLTDLVTVQSAEIVEYSIAATIYTFPGPDSAVVIAQATANANAYKDACHRLGREVTLSGLYAALHVPGVERVELESPLANVAVTPTQAPWCTGVTVAYGGVYG